MKLILENWNNFINESVAGPFHVIKRDKKIKGKNHYVIIHTPSDAYIPSQWYKMGQKNAQGLTDELNAYNSENDGLFENSELATDEDTLKTILDIINMSEYREGAINIRISRRSNEH